METNLVPFIPESAPFTPEQRAYLNGFLAGLFSRGPTDREAAKAALPSPPEQRPLSILFGSQTGNAEALAKRVAKEAGKYGFAPTIFEMALYPVEKLEHEQNLLIVTSTYGDGEPPDNARAFWQSLSSEQIPALAGLSFSVLALGDSNYPKFCEFGKNLDTRLESLGARRLQCRVDCDVEFEQPFRTWLDGIWTVLSNKTQTLASPAAESAPATSRHPRSNPYSAVLVTNRKLNGPGSVKDTRHLEISLSGSELSYQAGDALGVLPVNCPRLVEEILACLHCSGDESVPGTGHPLELPLREALLKHYDITRISQPLLHAFAQKTGDATLLKLTAPNVNGELTQFLWGREIVDLLLAFPNAKFAPAEFVSLLKKLQPRLYSISSSPTLHARQVHLTVGVVRYDSFGRKRHGVCSCFLADRISEGERVPVFIHENKNFRPPSDAGRPLIAVGPGTGIAPFRAFLHERKASGARGKNWLFFGDQHAATDFLYRDELETMVREGTLTRLDTAFSRDQSEKVYVQNRLLENARELFDWLEQGAHFYVCGDAKHMAKDVDAALHQVIQSGGGRSATQAAEYIARLKNEKRYQRDIY